MATADSLVSDLQSWTNETTTTLPNATALECVNEAIRRMQRRHNWRFCQASVDLSFGPALGSVALPPDFVQEVFLYTKDTSQTDPALALTPIGKTQRPSWFGNQSPLASTDPIYPQVAAPSSVTPVRDFRNYFIWGGLVWIVPTPSAAITVTLDYIRALPDLALSLVPPDQNDFTVWYPDAVRLGALREAYLFLHEFETAGSYDGLFTQAVKESIDRDNAIAFAGPSPARGK